MRIKPAAAPVSGASHVDFPQRRAAPNGRQARRSAAPSPISSENPAPIRGGASSRARIVPPQTPASRTANPSTPFAQHFPQGHPPWRFAVRAIAAASPTPDRRRFHAPARSILTHCFSVNLSEHGRDSAHCYEWRLTAGTNREHYAPIPEPSPNRVVIHTFSTLCPQGYAGEVSR